MIGEQPDSVQTQIRKNLRADAVLVLELPLPGLTLVVHEIAPVRNHARFPMPVASIALDAESRPRFVQIYKDTLLSLRDLLQRVAH